jgi:hypothetical protein
MIDVSLDLGYWRTETRVRIFRWTVDAIYSLSDEIMFSSVTKYAKRVARMTTLWTDGTVGWGSYKMGLRPNQIAVLTASGGFVFCSMSPEHAAV